MREKGSIRLVHSPSSPSSSHTVPTLIKLAMESGVVAFRRRGVMALWSYGVSRSQSAGHGNPDLTLLLRNSFRLRISLISTLHSPSACFPARDVYPIHCSCCVPNSQAVNSRTHGCTSSICYWICSFLRSSNRCFRTLAPPLDYV